jgi:hypothetical protein
MTFDSFVYPIAQKEYRCEWCGEKILKGDLHAKYVGKWQGDFQFYRMHDECVGALQDMDSNDDDGFTPFENERPRKTTASAS